MKKGMINFFVAIGFVIVGGILLLSNLNIISLEMKFTWEYIYPVLLFGAGVKLWGDSLSKNGGSWILGSFLTLTGTLLLLDRFGVIDFSFGNIVQLWPLLFIYIGFSLFFNGMKQKKKSRFEYHEDSNAESSGEESLKSAKMAIGSQEFKKDNWKVEPMDLWNGIGDYYFDFTRAFIPDIDTPISVRGWVGDVKMIIPKNVPFRVEAKIKTGDIKVAGHNADGLKRSLSYETEDYHSSARRLTFVIDYKVGSIQIDHV